MKSMIFFRSLQTHFAEWRVGKIGDKTFLVMAAVLTGIITSVLAVVLKVTVHFIQGIVQSGITTYKIGWMYIIYPLIGIFLSTLYVQRFLKGDLGRGTGLLLVDISRKRANVAKHKMYSQMISSMFTVGFGGSAGLEAPIVVTGSSYGSRIGNIFRMTLKEKTILIACGAAAGLSAIFNCPIAGVVFALEVILARVTVPVFIPILIASATSAVVSKLIYTGQPFYRISEEWDLSSIPFFLVLGLVSGLLSVYNIRVFSSAEDFFSKYKRPYVKSIVCGILLGIGIFFFPPLYGEGYSNLLKILNGDYFHLLENTPLGFLSLNRWTILLFAFMLMMLKVIATSLTINGGGNGGMFGSSLFTGAFLGMIFAETINMLGIAKLDAVQFVVVAMAGMLSGAIHAPLTAIFLIAEITGGYMLFVPLMIVSALSYFVSKYFEPYSVYTRKLALRGDLVLNNHDHEVLTHLRLPDLVEKDFITVPLNGKLRSLIEVIPKSKRNLFPVIDENKCLSGVIVLDDVRQLMFETEKYDEVLIRDIMTRPPETIQLYDDMSLVMKKFEDTQTWNLPVIKDKKYFGFISKSAIFSSYRTQLVEDLGRD